MNKKKRQDKLLEIISKMEVDTQEELIKILERQGIVTTQATISRDINEIGIVKVAGVEKRFRYSKPASMQRSELSMMVSHFKTAIMSITTAQNLVVVKTLSGNANAVGVIIDDRNLDGSLGSIAGDDTLLVIAKDSQSAALLAEKIKGVFGL